MKTEELINMVNMFFDGELEKRSEPVLFGLLADNEEAREYFKNLNKISAAMDNSITEFPDDLEERILYSALKKTEKQYFRFGFRNTFVFASYALAVLLIFISIFFYGEAKSYSAKLETVSVQMAKQNREIQMLINSLPAAEVDTKLDNAVIVKANL